MASWIAETRKRLYRNVKYQIIRPAPPAAPAPFKAPVVVVGSAPVSNKVKGWQADFPIITINGSQSVITPWGFSAPDITFLQFNQIEGTNTMPWRCGGSCRDSEPALSMFSCGARTIGRVLKRG